MRWLLLTVLLLAGQSHLADADPARPQCAAIARHVDVANTGRAGPLFLRSYEPGPDETALPPPLATTAFAYDNALAIMALISCGDTARAQRIGNAFVFAMHHDRTFTDGRIRNAYRAGPVGSGNALLPGWWDSARHAWDEDAYQDGTQTGNVAWVGLALLALDKAAPKSGYRAAALRLADWIAGHTLDTKGPGGFSGGEAGFDHAQTPLTWRSTEHNVDVYALGTWLVRLTHGSMPSMLATHARQFLDAMFDATNGQFRLGTLPDGAVQPPSRVALDALLWPLIGVAMPPKDWKQSLPFAERHLATHGGFDFNGSGGSLWTEGTAQASLVMRALGRETEARALLATALRQAAPSGYLYATDGGRVATGLSVGPESHGSDFFYFHRPHLGATAWAVLAAKDINPFTGPPVD